MKAAMVMAHTKTVVMHNLHGPGVIKTITIKQLGVTSMFRVELQVNKTKVMAVVDTETEVTTISDKLYESLPSKPKSKRHTMMHGAGRDMKMKTFIIGPVNIGIGSRIYPSDIYVVPIDDDMLLGLDVLYKYIVILDCSKNKFVINGENLPMDYGKAKNVPEMSKVTVPGKTVIPLNSVIHINGKMSSQIENYFIEPDSDIPVMIPMHMYANQPNPRLCLVNASDRYYTIRKDTVVGEAVSADPVELYQKAQQDDRGESTALTPSLELLVDKAGKQLANDHKEALEKL
jgi:hypothetical protein